MSSHVAARDYCDCDFATGNMAVDDYHAQNFAVLCDLYMIRYKLSPNDL